MADPAKPLRRGWTTGACAAAAAKAAVSALEGQPFPDPVTITLPRGETPSFALAACRTGENWAEAAIIKDAGDDPDVTHHATIRTRVARGQAGQGLRFLAGEGVGTITRPGLPLAVGEPAINPVPRLMIDQAIADVLGATGGTPDLDVTVSIDNGAELAKHTWNGRLGIVGGLSVLGTTGIVRPFSCSAWIASIHRGIDVAVASGTPHVIAATGATSEQAARALYDLDETACLDMGDFAGGVLKYLRRHPIPHLTLAGGPAKLAKLGQGALDLHSGRAQVDFATLGAWASAAGCNPAPVAAANTVLEALTLCPALATEIARHAREQALALLQGAPVAVDVLVVGRSGEILAQEGAP